MSAEKYAKLLEALGLGILWAFTHAQVDALLKFFEGKGTLPPEIVARIDFLAEVVNHLAGSYNNSNHGIYLWFVRPRVQLWNMSPAQIFSGDWKPEDEEPQKVLELAKALSGPMNAT